MIEDKHSVQAGLLALYASTVLLALNGVFAKIIPLDAINVTQTRSIVACLMLFCVLILQHAPLKLTSLKQFLGVYGLGIILGVHWITYFHSMQVSTVAIGMLSLFSYPVITVLIEPMFKKQMPKLSDMLAAFVVFSGIFIMVSPQIISGEFDGNTVQGAFWGLTSAVLFSLRNTSQKYVFPHVNSITLMAHQTLAIGIVLIPFLSVDQITSMAAQDWGLLVLLGCLSTALAHTFLSMSLKRLPAKSVALIGCNVPVVGGFIAWLALGEIPDFMVYIGGAVILSVAAYESLNQNK